MKLISFSTKKLFQSGILHPLSVVLFFTLLYTLFFAPVIFSGRLLAPGDGIVFYVPAFYSIRTLWTDLILSGFPVAADPQTQTWYPISLFFSLIPNSWNAFVLCAYVLASCFTYGYVYSLTQLRLAALVSGIIYGMSGFMIAHLGHTVIIHGAAWMPLLIWTADRLRDRIRPLWFVIGALAVSCSVLAGHPQISFYSLGLSTIYVLCLGGKAAVGRWRYYRTYLAVIALGISLTAIQLIPTAELSGLGLRSRMTFDQFVSFSLPVEQIIQFLFPYLFGGGGPFNSFYDPPYFGGWNFTEMAGYMGLLPLMLAIVGFIVHRDRPIARFWLGAGAIALLLALGKPLAYLTYHLPVYNKFRAPARHLMEVGWAVSVLAGLGVAAIQTQAVSKLLSFKIIKISAGIFLIALTSIFIFSGALESEAIAAGSQPLSFLPWTNPAVGVPLVIFLLAITVVLYSINAKPSQWGVLVLVLLVIDIGSFGWFYEWRYGAPSQDALTPTTVIAQYRDKLTQRQQRILTPRGATGNFHEMPPNLSRIWGVPSASGYGPLMLSRYSELFPMGAAGDVWGQWASASNRTLDLMAVRYIFIPTWGLTPVTNSQGIGWHSEDMNLSLGQDCLTNPSNSVKFYVPSQPQVTAIGIVSSMACSQGLSNDAEVLRISVQDVTGETVTQTLRAGTDTAEWAYDCSDVRPQMQHKRAPIFSSVPHKRPSFPDCERHNYLSVLPLNLMNPVQDIQLEWIGASGAITLHKMSLINQSTGQSYPITEVSSAIGNPNRWRRMPDIPASGEKPSNGGGYWGAHVYENRQAMSRAWLVPEVVSAEPKQVLEAIQSSRLPDGRPYEPTQVALVEAPLNFNAKNPDVAATAQVLSLSNTHVEVQTDSTSAAFLVLSDVYYPGWRATIDGKPTPIFQTNYVLRGVQVPAGNHRVTFEFNPVSFHIGLGVSSASLVLLGYLAWKLSRSQNKIDNPSMT